MYVSFFTRCFVCAARVGDSGRLPCTGVGFSPLAKPRRPVLLISRQGVAEALHSDQARYFVLPGLRGCIQAEKRAEKTRKS